jgi:hypothetical protein
MIAVLDERSDVSQHAEAALKTQPYMSADSFLSSLPAEVVKAEAYCRAVAAPVTVDAADPKPEPKDDPQDATKIDPKIDAADHLPVPLVPEPIETKTNAEKYLPLLKIDALAAGQFEVDEFESWWAAAELRFNQFAEIVVANDDPNTWLDQVTKSQVLSRRGETSKTLFVIDPENACEYHGGGRLKRLYSRMPAVDKVLLERLVTLALGPAGSSPADRLRLGACFIGNHDFVLHVYDCRKENQHTKIMRLVKKHMANLNSKMFKMPWSFRLFHSNSEFSSKNGLHSLLSDKNNKTHSKTRAFSRNLLPEPMESITIVTSKGVRVDDRPRRWVDVPGTTITRGLSNVPVRQGYGDGNRKESNMWVSLSSARMVMRGCVASKMAPDGADEDDEDGESDDKSDGAE